MPTYPLFCILSQVSYLEQFMAKSYLDLMQQARELAEKDIHRIVRNLEEYAQHFPELVERAVGAIVHHKGGKTTAAVTVAAAPVTAVKAAAPVSAAASAAKPKSKRSHLSKVESEELRGAIKSALKGKVKQVEFVEKFVAAHPHYKAKVETVKSFITKLRASGAIKSEPVVKGNFKAGIYLMPGK
jgi:hypothetical protein